MSQPPATTGNPRRLGDIGQIIEQGRQQLANTLDQTRIPVDEYRTALLPRELPQAKLHEAITRSRARLKNRGDDA